MSRYGVIRGPKRARFEKKSPKLMIILHIRTQDRFLIMKLVLKKTALYISLVNLQSRGWELYLLQF